jgi:site-specific recombinase XerC
MLAEGHPVSDIRNKLGHEDIQSTMVYLKLDLTKKNPTAVYPACSI